MSGISTADPLGDELKALRVVIEELDVLPADVRSRVIGYVFRRFPNPERPPLSQSGFAQASQGTRLHG